MDDESKNKITKLINDRYLLDIESGLTGRTCYKVAGDACETTGHILVGAAALVAFASGTWNINYLSYIAGSISILSVSLLKLSSYFQRESRERTDMLNLILSKLKIDNIVDISFDSSNDIRSISNVKINTASINTVPVNNHAPINDDHPADNKFSLLNDINSPMTSVKIVND